MENKGVTVQQLYGEINEKMDQIQTIQEACSHPKNCVTKKYGSNTGNYDPSSDCYWTDFQCMMCLKKWTEDGSK